MTEKAVATCPERLCPGHWKRSPPGESTVMKPAILLYDATCRFCTASARPALRLVPRGTVRLADVNDPQMQIRYGITPAAAARAMHLVLPNGRIRKGAAAVRALLRLSRWAFPLAWAWYLPGFPALAARTYGWVADHRYLFLGRTTPPDCTNESCAIHVGRPHRTRKGP